MVEAALNPAVIAATAQQRRAADPEASAWVDANAGSGKTKVLADRVLALLLRGVLPERILCLTYTRAAAAEMRIRIERELAGWATAPDEELDTALVRLGAEAPDGDGRNRARRLFARTVDAPVGLRIDTIHAFCQSLLGRFPIEAGVSPWFQLADEREAVTRQANARDAVLERRGDGMEAAAAEIADNLSEYNIRAFIAELLRNRSAFGPGALAALEAALVLPEVPERTKKATKALRKAVSILAGGGVTDKRHAASLQRWADIEAPSDDDIDEVRKVFYKSNGEPREEFGTKNLVGGERLPGLLDEECERIERLREHRKIEATLNASRAALALGEAVDGEYQRSKGRAGLLDYDDLIEHALGLLQSYSAAWVHYKLDRGIDHVLIDEAQDTSPAQWGLVEALTQEFFAGEGAGEEVRTLFAVGDPKQSIYRFQGAEPKKFGDMRETLRTRAEGAGRRWEDVPLEVSFRAAPVLLEAVDAVFAGEHGLGLEGPAPRHRASRAGAGGRVEIWPLEMGEKQEPGDPFEPPRTYLPEDAAETALADRVAGRIASWLERGEPVAPGGRPMRAGDIMILLPRRSGRAFIPRVIAALKQAGVPVAGIDRMTLAEELAVMDLAAIGDFVLLPEDDLTLATVLKGPLFGFDDEALFELARGRRGTLWAALGKRRVTERFGPCFEALGALLARADYVGVHAFFADLLAEGGLRLRIASRLGEEANDPIDEFLNAALDYERRHASSLQGFLQWLRSGEAEVKRQLDQRDLNEVRVSTVHGAKGLEAPVVILPDTASAPAHPSRRQTLYRDGGLLLWPPSTNRDRIDPVSEALLDRADREDEEEHCRLLYVAMTRAADRLVICGWNNSGRKLPDDCWYNAIRDRLAPCMAEEDDPDFDERLLVMERCATEAEAARPAADREATPPLPDWARAPVAAEPVPPSGDDGEAFAPASPLRGRSVGRFRRGRAVHKLLELLPEIAPERRLETARRFLAADPELATGAEAAAREVMAVLDDPAFSRVFGPGSRAEAPLVGRIGGEIVSARIDRLALLPEETLIVDFKSGRAPPADPAEAPAAYLRQLARYVVLLRQMRPDRPVRAALLWTEAPLLMPIPESCLAPYMP